MFASQRLSALPLDTLPLRSVVNTGTRESAITSDWTLLAIVIHSSTVLTC